MTILPPNGPSCSYQTETTDDGIFSAGSYHPGGIQAALTDGSVTFIAETINAKTDPALTTGEASVTSGRSPYGTWGALGTRNGGEVLADF